VVGTKKIQIIASWCIVILFLLFSIQFFILGWYTPGMLFFLLASTTNPLFFMLLKEKKINYYLPMFTIIFLFVLFTVPSYLFETKQEVAPLQQVAPAHLQENPVQATYVIKDYKDSKIVVHKAPSKEAEKPVYVPKKEQKVKITNKAFVPQNITIERGTTVVWINTDPRLQIIHIVNTTGGYTSIARSGRLEEGDSFSMRFDSIGEYPYRGLLLKAPHGMITVTQ